MIILLYIDWEENEKFLKVVAVIGIVLISALSFGVIHLIRRFL